MGWKVLNDDSKKKICSKCRYSSMELLENLIDEYGFYYYSSFDNTFPILSILGSYKFKLSFAMEDSDNKEKFRLGNELRSTGNLNIDNEVFDHAILLKTQFYNDVYIVSNPYLENEKLNEILGFYVGKKRYSILGKEYSYYYPNKTNIFLLKIS